MMIAVEISGDYLKVEFDNIEYELPKCDESEYGIVYGEIVVSNNNPMPLFDTFPLSIQLTTQQPTNNVLVTNIPGEHTIKIITEQESITVTQDFAKAVKKAVNEPEYDYIIPETTMVTSEYAHDLNNGDVVIVNYCDVTNIIDTSKLNAWLQNSTSPLYVTVNGEITTISNPNEFDNYTNPTNFDGHSFVLTPSQSVGEKGGNDRSWMCFPEAGEYTFSMYTISENAGSGSSLKNIKDAENGGIIEGSIESNTASGQSAHAEGSNTTASGGWSHAEGSGANASGEASHAEGGNTKAQGHDSHAEGKGADASGEASHAQNLQTIAQGYAQTVIGKYNKAQGTASSNATSDYAFIIGNGTGTSTSNRSNALAIKWDGTFVFANGTEITPAQFQSLLALLS